MCDKKLEFILISFESEKKARDSLESVSSFLKKTRGSNREKLETISSFLHMQISRKRLWARVSPCQVFRVNKNNITCDDITIASPVPYLLPSSIRIYYIIFLLSSSLFLAFLLYFLLPLLFFCL
jgi:hypothetical protein